MPDYSVNQFLEGIVIPAVICFIGLENVTTISSDSIEITLGSQAFVLVCREEAE